MKQNLLIIICLLSILSCSLEVVKDEKSYAYSINIGSKFVLNQKIEIKPNLGRTFMQYGKIKNEKDIDIYYPHCSITVNSIQEQAQIISPTTFEIIKIVDDEEYAQNRLLFASTNLKLVSDGPLITGLVSYYYLKSADEPDVRSLECTQWDSLYENNYLSISEVRQALGDVFTLELNN